MENWFEDVGRTVLLEALGDACDQINTSFKTGRYKHLSARGLRRIYY